MTAVLAIVIAGSRPAFAAEPPAQPNVVGDWYITWTIDLIGPAGVLPGSAVCSAKLFISSQSAQPIPNSPSSSLILSTFDGYLSDVVNQITPGSIPCVSAAAAPSNVKGPASRSGPLPYFGQFFGHVLYNSAAGMAVLTLLQAAPNGYISVQQTRFTSLTPGNLAAYGDWISPYGPLRGSFAMCQLPAAATPTPTTCYPFPP
jgi:hypothetical protein